MVIICVQQSFFGFGAGPDIEISFDGEETRKQVEIRNDEGKKEYFPMYVDGETISGQVSAFNINKYAYYVWAYLML